MFGGIAFDNTRIPNVHTHESAVRYFFDNSTIRILTNNSISCITFVLELNVGFLSPFMNFRLSDRNTLGGEVRRLLFKIFPTDSTSIRIHNVLARPRDRGDHNVEIATRNSFEREIRIQMDIYFRTLVSEENFLDPICACIVFFQLNYTGIGIQEIVNRLLPRNGETLHNERLQALNTMNAGPRRQISIIVMEFLDGFEEGFDIFNPQRTTPQEQMKIASYARYELDKLHDLGYVHGDFHPGNFMGSLTSTYVDVDPQDVGRVMLLDFGRTTLIRQGAQGIADIQRDYDSCRMAQRYVGRTLTYYPPYTRDYITTSRITKSRNYMAQLPPPQNILNLYNSLFGANQQNRQRLILLLPPPPPPPPLPAAVGSPMDISPVGSPMDISPPAPGPHGGKLYQSHKNKKNQNDDLIILPDNFIELITNHVNLLENLYNKLNVLSKRSISKTKRSRSISKNKSKSKYRRTLSKK
jgi:serine/threonine protein kinase